MPTQTSPELLMEWYASMVNIREFESRVMELFSGNHVRGSTHLASGQEAVAVGAAAALIDGDKTFCTYRGHHHCLARGMDEYAAMAEILGRSDGVCGGRGGSMHLTDTSKGLYGSYAIVGAQIPIAVGSAWSSQLRETDEVTTVFFGDGTTTIGAFHEAIGLAAIWKLPIVFICENNLYSEYSPTDTVVPVEHAAADRAPAYGIPGVVVDGNDVQAVHDVVAEAVKRARAGDGPTIVEAKTYRRGGHSRADPGLYRPDEEVAHWLARDPIVLLGRVLVESGVTQERLDELSAQIIGSYDAIIERALASPEPLVEELLTNVYAS